MAHPDGYRRLQTGRTGWPEVYEGDELAQTWLQRRVRELLAQRGPSPLYNLVVRIFARGSAANVDRPGTLARVQSVDMQYALVECALRAAKCEERWHAPE